MKQVKCIHMCIASKIVIKKFNHHLIIYYKIKEVPNLIKIVKGFTLLLFKETWIWT